MICFSRLYKAKWFVPDLSKKILANLLDPLLLEGVYIPNLVASPFIVNKAYAKLIYNRTSSSRLSKVLRKWDEERWNAPERRQKLAWVLLVELLSYQFASLVRWIKTWTSSSSNISLSASSRLALLQRSQAWLHAPSRPHTRPRTT